MPKERWISFPYCEGEDGTLMIAWAGYDHLQLAKAISAYYVDVQERLGGRDDPRLVPLLACLIELLPWLKAVDLHGTEERYFAAKARLLLARPDSPGSCNSQANRRRHSSGVR